LGILVNTGAHDLAAAILRRLWGTEGCGDACISIARRLLSEAPSETKDEVLDQMRSATRRGDLLLLEIWRRDWLPAEAPDPGAPGRGAARLLVDLIESSMGGFRSNQLFRNIFDDQDPAAMNGLVSWLWHPAVDTVIREREAGIAALPGLWMLPEEYRRLVLDAVWEPSDTFLTVWWFGFMVGIGDENAISDPLPLVFRAMALADWAVMCSDTPQLQRLSTAITRILSPKQLRALRLVLHGLDAAMGDVLQMMLSGTVVRAHERRSIEARVRPLREHIRSLRRAAVSTAAGA
jgi:hypothetical protein